MSKTEDQSNETTEETKKSPMGIIFAILIFLAIVIVVGLTNNAKVTTSEPTETAKTEQGTSTDATQTAHASDGTETTTQEVSADFDLEKASTPRILGNPDAPIKISEHSSFTCGGCAMFHKSNFKMIKEEYIDTGKAYIVFDDFPRNKYDIIIGSVARCVPENAYFNFVQLLFETQKNWLNEEYLTHLKQNAKLTGASDAQINNCLNSTELHKALAERQAAAGKDHGVDSTPTLVINDSVVISGLDPYAAIKAALEAALVKPAE